MDSLTVNPPSLDATPRRLGERLAALLYGQRSNAPRVLRHVETLPLGPKRSLYLVECDGERFLVAAGGESLSAPVPLMQRLANRPASEGQDR